MDTENKTNITVRVTVQAPVEKVWQSWTEPAHIKQWTHASDDWHAPYADNDLRTNGKFKTTMAAVDGSVSFDFEGVYTNVKELELIEYTLGDGRMVSVSFARQGNDTEVVETFEAEGTNSVELQHNGWQAILENFKKYTEASV